MMSDEFQCIGRYLKDKGTFELTRPKASIRNNVFHSTHTRNSILQNELPFAVGIIAFAYPVCVVVVIFAFSSVAFSSAQVILEPEDAGKTKSNVVQDNGLVKNI